MYTDPEIVNAHDLSKRAYITFNYNGERCRYYNGDVLKVKCCPNRTKTLAERERLLVKLKRDFERALLKGWIPPEPGVKVEVKEKPAVKPVVKLEDAFKKVQKDMAGGSYSDTYQRDLASVSDKFTEFLVQEGVEHTSPDQVTTATVERFLQQFSSSGTYYRDKRRDISMVFSKLVKQGFCKANPVVETSTRKAKVVLHEAYTPEQIGPVLAFLKENQPNLYLCALLLYGAVLRPHQEVRLLKRKHFDKNLTRFLLEGSENKGGRIRSLPITGYVRAELLRRGVQDLEPEANIFTGCLEVYNKSYFNTMWSRAKKKMLLLGLINTKQTLYSFRHSAAIDVFNRTKNLKLVQELFDHASINTTIIYLRSLGVVIVENSQMPVLEL